MMFFTRFRGHRDGVTQASITARRVVVLSFLATAVLVMALLAGRVVFLSQHAERTAHVVAAQGATDRIVLLDERLTMAAYLAATTGERRWIERYEQQIPLMDEALMQAQTLAGPDRAGQFERDTRAANDRLVALERLAFEQAAAGNYAAGQAVLDSGAYAEDKRLLADASGRFFATLSAEALGRQRQTEQRAWWVFALLVLTAALAFAAFWRRLNARLQQSEETFLRSQAEVTRLAMFDGLTGLANRRSLQMQLDRALARGAREPAERFALLVLDLDHFKPVNDRYGHSAGDAVLSEIARRLKAEVRAGDLACRLGGDEFVLLLDRLEDEETPLRAAKRVIAALGEPIDLAGTPVQVGASVGIAVYPADGASSDDLLRRADMALYKAKAAGRGQCRFFQESMDREVHDRAQLELDLRDAIARGQVVPYFQPLVELASGQVTGFEVLARWQHPTRGLVPPAEFIPVAEDVGLIHSMTLSLLGQAVHEARSWGGQFTLAINIAPQQLKDETLGAALAAVLGMHGFPASRLEIEITENALIGDLAQARRVLQDLKQRGMRLALDDFGTGYSSLASLSELPFDKIKIDRSFVHSMHTRPQSETIVQAAVALGHSLNLMTTAEGIETPLDAAALMALGCGSGQGFLYARPVPGGEVPALLQRLHERRSDAPVALA